MKNLILLLSLLLSVGQSMAQSSLKGIVTDENDDDAGVPAANVVLKKNGEMLARTSADFDGNYQISNIPADTYELEVSSIGLATLKFMGIQINDGATKTYDIRFPLNSGVRRVTGYGERSVFFYFRLRTFKISYHLRNELHKYKSITN